MAEININAGNISSVNLREQGSDISAPANGVRLYNKASGIFFVDSSGLVSGPLNAMFTPGGRLSLQSGTSVTTTDMHSGTVLWYNPHDHPMIPLWDGNKDVPVQFDSTPISLSGLSGTSSFDVFAYNNSGVLAFETSMWASPTVRAVDITKQGGRYRKSGDATRLYIGSFYTSASGQTDDSILKRFVYNYYNRVQRKLYKTDNTGHTYTTAAWRAWNNSTSNAFTLMVGVSENPLNLYLLGSIYADADAVAGFNSVGYDVTNAEIENYFRISNSNQQPITAGISMPHLTGIGFHTYTAIEYGASTSSFALYTLRGTMLG